MSGQLYAPTALPPVPIRQGTGLAPEPVWTTWKGKYLPLPGGELRPLGCPAIRYTD
jgi:hypothetical protein